MVFDPENHLWIFGDMMGVLRAMDIESQKIFRLLEMPRKLDAGRMYRSEDGKYLIVDGRIHKDLYKSEGGIQVYDLRNLLLLKKEDSSDFQYLTMKKP